MAEIEKKYPFYLKSTSGFNNVMVVNPFNYIIVMAGNSDGHSCFSFDNVSAPRERVERFVKDADLVEATAEEFRMCCDKIAKFKLALGERVAKF